MGVRALDKNQEHRAYRGPGNEIRDVSCAWRLEKVTLRTGVERWGVNVCRCRSRRSSASWLMNKEEETATAATADFLMRFERYGSRARSERTERAAAISVH